MIGDMLPILIEFAGITLYTFGIFLMLAFFWGCFFLWKNIRLTAYKEETVFDGLFFALILGGIVGRLVYVGLNFSQFGFDLVKIILVNGYPGFSMLGFLAGFFIGYAIFAAGQKIRFHDLIDYVIPALFLALGIGKVGSFFAGIEFGSETTFPIAVVYANIDGLRHITPLYEGLAFFLGSYWSFRMLFMIRRDVLDHGFLFHFFLWFTAFIFFVFSFIRGEQIMVYGYGATMAVSAFVLLTFSIYFVYYFRAAILRPIIGSFSKKQHGKSSQSGVHSETKAGSARRRTKNSS